MPFTRCRCRPGPEHTDYESQRRRGSGRAGQGDQRCHGKGINADADVALSTAGLAGRTIWTSRKWWRRQRRRCGHGQRQHRRRGSRHSFAEWSGGHPALSRRRPRQPLPPRMRRRQRHQPGTPRRDRRQRLRKLLRLRRTRPVRRLHRQRPERREAQLQRRQTPRLRSKRAA